MKKLLDCIPFKGQKIRFEVSFLSLPYRIIKSKFEYFWHILFQKYRVDHKFVFFFNIISVGSI